ncbi:MAG: hypothetical protein GX614_12540 [Sandaracinaceae bacterium]|nr:hypothetical protein [Sandaracinaceae bacterium]
MKEREGERRLDERLRINREFDSFEDLIDEFVVDISERGAFIRTRGPYAIGDLIPFRFAVLTPELERIEGEARVVRLSDNPPGIGVEFTKLAAFSRYLIERLRARQARSD